MGRLISMGIAHKNFKMKIALVIYGSLNTLSGGYLYDRMLVDYLKSQGDDVKVISIPNKSYHNFSYIEAFAVVPLMLHSFVPHSEL